MLNKTAQGTKEADLLDQIGPEPASQDSNRDEAAVGSPPNESPNKVRVMRKDKEAYNAAVRAGLAQPGRIKQWLHDRDAAHRATLAVAAESSKSAQDRPALQPPNQTPKPTQASSFPYSIKNKGWKQMRNKPASRTTFDPDGNPVTVEIGADDAAAVSPTTDPQTPDAGPDAWRSKIFLSTVECEQDGVQPPTPEFPFRPPPHNPVNSSVAQGKKRKRGRKCVKATADHREPEPTAQNTADATTTTRPTTTATATTQEDLPMLPADMSCLSALSLPLRLGTVVAFKHFCLSRNYVPEITDYRTARVEKVHTDLPDGPLLELRLAIRDRPHVQYDEETGERVLGKFDMPGFGDGEEEGYLELNFNQLLEAKVVRLPEGGAESEVQQEEDVTTREGGNDENVASGGGDGGYDNPDELDYGEDVHRNSAPSSTTTTTAQPNTAGQTAHMEIEEASAVAGEPEQEKPDNGDSEQGQQQDTGLQAGLPEAETFGPMEQGQSGDGADQEMHEPPPTPPPVAIPPHDPLPETELTGRQSSPEHSDEPVEPRQLVEAYKTPSPTKPNRVLKNGFRSREKPSWNDPLFGESPSPPPPSAVKPTVPTTPSPPAASQRSVRSRRPPPTPPTIRPAAQRAATRSNPQFDHDTDSDDGVPSIETWLLKEAQSPKGGKGKAKEAEKAAASASAKETDSPALPPLPQFSPLAVRAQERQAEPSIAGAGTTKRRTSAAMARGGKTAKRNTSTTGGNKNTPSTPKKLEPVYVDLTLSSPGSPQEPPP